MSGDPAAGDEPTEEGDESTEPSDSREPSRESEPEPGDQSPEEQADGQDVSEDEPDREERTDEQQDVEEGQDDSSGDGAYEDDDLAPQADLQEGWAGVEGSEPESDEEETEYADAEGDEGEEGNERGDETNERDDDESEAGEEPDAEAASVEGEDDETSEQDDEGGEQDDEEETEKEDDEGETEEEGNEDEEDEEASERDGDIRDEDEEGEEMEHDESDEPDGEDGEAETTSEETELVEGEEDEEDLLGPVDMPDDPTPIERKSGPEYDQEQPLAEHIEEMIKRLAVVVVVAGLVSLLAFPFGEDFITFLWYSVLPVDVSQPHVYHPLELIITQLKAASLLGLVIALPVFVYQTYLFMRPGLYPHERRYYLAAVPTSLVLAFVGLLFGYFLVLPAVMTYFLYYSEGVVDIAFALGQTFNLMLILLGYLALVFQIPLFIMLAIMMGLTSRRWLEGRRLIFWGAFLGISFLFSPDPTGMAPFLVAGTMVGLFEGTLLLLRWTNRG